MLATMGQTSYLAEHPTHRRLGIACEFGKCACSCNPSVAVSVLAILMISDVGIVIVIFAVVDVDHVRVRLYIRLLPDFATLLPLRLDLLMLDFAKRLGQHPPDFD